MHHLLLLLLVLCSVAHAELSARLGDCAPKSCGGTSPNISFPFYLKSSSKSYCGHTLFAVSCNNGLPVMTFSGANYSITNITYDKKAFTLRQASHLEAGGGGRRCSLPSRNFSLVDTFFEPSHGWLYFHSNCTHLEGKSSGTGGHDYINLTCGGADGENGTREYYYVGWKEERKDMSCRSVVKYPATDAWRPGVVGPRDVLNQSFGLSWKGLECGRCTASGGECAYDHNKTSSVCICGHGVCSIHCEKEGGAKEARLIVLVVSLITGSFLLASFLFVHLVHIKKKNISFRGTCLQGISSNDNSTRERELLENHFQTHMFSYRELEEATDGFASSREIGNGGFGIVYRGKLRDGRVVAVKRLYERSRRRMEQFANEVSIFSRVRHKNLVSLYGCTNCNNRELLLVYEYISNGTVADHLYDDGSREEQPLTWPMRMSIAIETAEVLAYLHTIEPPIIHRDIKTSNILLDDHYHVKVADFGLSRLFPPDASYVSTAPQGTPGYLDPEYHRCYQLTDKSDVYSFGVVLAELVSSKPAVDISRDVSEINLADMAINKIQSGLIHELFDRLLGFETYPEVGTTMEEVAMLIFRCLQAEKVLRPSMQEVTERLKEIATQLKARDEIDSQMLAGKWHKKSVCSEV